jgi:hypothetical protein
MRPYDWIRPVADRLGAPGDYEVFGVLVAPAFLLIGAALLPRAQFTYFPHGSPVGFGLEVAILALESRRPTPRAR